MREFLDKFTGNISPSALLVSVFFWSWMDLVPFSPLLATAAGGQAEPLSLTLSLLVATAVLLALYCCKGTRELTLRPLAFSIAALLFGCLGSLAMYAGYLWGAGGLLMAASILSGFFQAVGVTLVGSLAVCQGKTNALIHLAACLPANIVFVLLGMFLQPGASVFLCCALPLLAALSYKVYLERSNNAEVIRTVLQPAVRAPAAQRGAIAPNVALLLLVTVAFGFVNCRVMYFGLASAPGPVSDYCSLFVRAVVAGAVFCAYVFCSRQPSEFLVVAVAVMALGLFALWLAPADSPVALVVASTLFYAGYALFDLLIWAIIVVLHRGSRLPIQRFLCGAYAVDQLGNFLGTALGTLGMADGACSLALAALGALLLVCAFTALNMPGSSLRDLRGPVIDREDGESSPVEHSPAETAPTHPEAPSIPHADRDIRRLASRYFLTEREADILALLFSGRSVPYISEQLTVSPNTVKTHVRHIYAKLDVHNRQELLDLFERPENK